MKNSEKKVIFETTPEQQVKIWADIIFSLNLLVQHLPIEFKMIFNYKSKNITNEWMKENGFEKFISEN